MCEGKLETNVKILNGEAVGLTRALWEEVFNEDSKAFTDYYFEYKAPENVCFTIWENDEMVSMLHLTPYDICVNKTGGAPVTYHTYYIVGVATKEQYRHKGYMTRMLEAAFDYMRKQDVLFTFLMPASPAIYEPFGFRYIYERTDYELRDYEPTEGACAQSLTIRKAKEEDCVGLAEFAETELAKRYNFYLKRDETYYRRLMKETESENGAVFMVYHENELAGYFLYAIEEEAFIQEVLLNDEAEKLLTEAEQPFLRKKAEKKPIIMGKYLGGQGREDDLLKELAEGVLPNGFINEVV